MAEITGSTIDKVDVRIIYPIIRATEDTFKGACNINVRPGKPRLESHAAIGPREVIALVSIISPTLNGQIALCFSKVIFLKVVSAMLDETFTEINPDIEDAAAELINMIFGNAKKPLNDKGHNVQRAIPTVIHGDAIKIRYLSMGQTVIMPFDSDIGAFHIEITSEQRQ